jgi:hypothetical protein
MFLPVHEHRSDAAMAERPMRRSRNAMASDKSGQMPGHDLGPSPAKKTTPASWAGVGPDSCRRRQRSPGFACQEDRMLDELIELIAEEIAKRS